MLEQERDLDEVQAWKGECSEREMAITEQVAHPRQNI